MKKMIFTFWLFFLSFSVYAGDLRDQMLPNNNTVGLESEWTDTLNQIFIYIKDFLFAILWLIAIGVFLYFWFKLISSRGNEEDFKKALMWFVYAVIGLAIIPLAWGAVRLIVSLDF